MSDPFRSVFSTQAAESAAAIAKADASAALEAEVKHTSENTSSGVARNALEAKNLRGTEPKDVEGATKAQGQLGQKGLTKKVGLASREDPVEQSGKSSRRNCVKHVPDDFSRETW